MIIIYHNPRCSKSRECLEILETAKADVEVVKYLDEPLTPKKLKKIIKLLQCEVIDIVRTNEKLWKDNFKDLKISDDELIDLLIEYPKLLERPIIINGNKAIVGRPPKKVLDLL